MRCFSIVTLVLLTAGSSLGQSSSTLLRDGQQLTLTGRLTMEAAGRMQSVTVKTVAAYQPVFKGERSGKDEQASVLHEIGLAGYSDYALLYAHRGQQVTVTGKMATDNASPYFWRGTRLQVTSIRLANGMDLLRSQVPANEPIAIDTGTYDTKAMLPADLAAPWVYTANGEPAREGRFLSCGSNGGGDVVNCFCAKGFHPIAAEALLKGSRSQGQISSDMNVAQFGVADKEGNYQFPVTLSVTCSR